MTTIDTLERCVEYHIQTCGCRDVAQKSGQCGPVIAITRLPGCDGESIAKALAEELGLLLYAGEIVEQIAKDTNMSERMIATLDEKLRPELDGWLSSLAGGPSLSAHRYMVSLQKVLFTIAAHGKAVILGRGANFLLPPEKRTIGLCLVAPVEVKVANVMKALCLSRENALAHIAQREVEQRLWIKNQCNADINDATNYHMIINTSLVTTDTIVQVVREMIAAKSQKASL